MSPRGRWLADSTQVIEISEIHHKPDCKQRVEVHRGRPPSGGTTKKARRKNLSRQLRARADCELRGWALSVFSYGENVIAAWKIHPAGNDQIRRQRARVFRCPIPFGFRCPSKPMAQASLPRQRFSIRSFCRYRCGRLQGAVRFRDSKTISVRDGDDVERREAPPQIFIHARRNALASQRVKCRRRRRIAIDGRLWSSRARSESLGFLTDMVSTRSWNRHEQFRVADTMHIEGPGLPGK